MAWLSTTNLCVRFAVLGHSPLFYNPKLDAKFPHFFDKGEKKTHLESKYLYWMTEVHHFYPWK